MNWGIPRRVYRDGTNVRVEHWREGEVMTEHDGCEFPDRYAAYLVDYALWACWRRQGPGHDPLLAAYYGARWARHVARITRRLTRLQGTVDRQLGGTSLSEVTGPPRPRLPWNYPARTR